MEDNCLLIYRESLGGHAEWRTRRDEKGRKEKEERKRGEPESEGRRGPWRDWWIGEERKRVFSLLLYITINLSKLRFPFL